MPTWYVPSSQRIGRLTYIDPANRTGVALGREHKLLPIVIEFDLMWVDVDPQNGNRNRGPEFVDTDNPSPFNKNAWIRSYWGPDLKTAAQKVDEFLSENAAEYGATQEKPKRMSRIVVSDDEADEFKAWKERKRGRPVEVSDEDAVAVDSYMGAKPIQGPRKVRS